MAVNWNTPEWFDAPGSIEDYRVGDRVELHPGTDAWMMGMRFGNVVKVGRKLIHIKMDVTGRTLRAAPTNVGRIQERG